MSIEHDESLLIHNGKPISFTSFSKLWEEAISEKLTSVSEQKYFSVLEIVTGNELHYDSLKLFSKLIPNLLKARAKELIYMILAKPPKLSRSESEIMNKFVPSFVRSFEAYKEFAFTLISFDCSFLLKVINFALNEALKLCTLSVSDKISLVIGQDNRFEDIEEIQQRARAILQGSKKKEFTQIVNHKDEDFIKELFKTHPNAKEKGIIDGDKTMKVFKGRSNQNTPWFFVSFSNDTDTVRSTPSQDNGSSSMLDISYMKCINEVAVNLSHSMINALKDIYLDVKLLIDLVIQIAEMFPFNKPKILSIILKMIPHSALHVQMHAIYIRILFYIMEKMPYYEEEILEAVLTRFVQIDAHIKSKQLENKRHFTSQDLKADIYLYYLIQHFKSRLNDIEEESYKSLKTKDMIKSGDVQMKDDSDDDSILDSSDEEDTKEDSITVKKNKIDKFWDMLIRLFENNVLPFSESHYPQYCFLYVCSINQMFLQKLITLFILRAFNNSKSSKNTKEYKSDNIASQTCVNYICSLLATSGKEIIPINIFLDSIRFLVKFFKGRFHSKKLIPEHFETYSSHSDSSEWKPKIVKKSIKVEDKLFYINMVQGLSYILSFKIPEIETQDPNLLTKILKLILNNEHKAVLYNQSSLLLMLQDSLIKNRVQSKYIRRLAKLMKEQKSFLRFKRDLFNRVRRKMPYGTPLFLIKSGVYFEHIHSHLPNNQIQESIGSTLIPPENKQMTFNKPNAEEDKFLKPMRVQKGKEANFEDRKFNSAMIAAFGMPKKANWSKDIKNTIFGKLGRSLSVDYKHKQKSARKSDASQDQYKIPSGKGLVKKINFDEIYEEQISKLTLSKKQLTYT